MTDEDTEEEKENKEEIESKYSDEGTPSKNNGNVMMSKPEQNITIEDEQSTNRSSSTVSG